MSAIDWIKAEWDRISGFACIGIGGLLVFFGYLGASGSTHTPEALSYLISGGVGGLFLLGAGATLLLSADLHDEWRKLDRLEDAFRSGMMTGSASAEADKETGVDLTDQSRSRAEARVGSGASMARAQVAETSSSGAAAVTIEGLAIRRLRALAAAGLGVALLPIGLGWNHTASRLTDGPAMDGVSVAAIGLILAGLAVALPTWSMRRNVRARAGRLLRPFSADLDRITADAGSAPADAQLTSSTGSVLVGDGLSRYHAPGCPAVRGLTGVRALPRSEVSNALTPCQLCLAD